MVAFGYKAGIGTASRLLPGTGTALGVLVLANFGARRDLVVDGVPVGELLGGSGARESAGSCIAVVATDAALGTHELTRIARRCGLGLARTGSVAYSGSGEIFVALSTSAGDPRPAGADALNELFAATVEATEEAVVNALWAAPDVVGREGRLAPGIPHDDVLELLRAHGRLG
jgi:D-aminopeptidase